MTMFRILAVAAVATTMVTGSAMARDGHHRGFGGAGVAIGAGIAGAAIGAGLAASSPYRDSYAYYGDDYAPGYAAPRYGYGRNYGGSNYGGSTWNSDAGAGGYNTEQGNPSYQPY